MKKPLSLPLAALLGFALIPLLLTSCADYYGYGSGYGYYDDGYYDAYPYYGGGYYTSSAYLGSSYYRHKRYRCSKCNYYPCRCGHHHSHKYYKGSSYKHPGYHHGKHKDDHKVVKHPGSHPYHGSRDKPDTRSGHRDDDRRGDHTRSRPPRSVVTSTNGRPSGSASQPKTKPTKSGRPSTRTSSPRTSSPPASRSKTNSPSVRNVPVTTSRSAPKSTGAHRPKPQKTNPNPRGRRKK